MKETRQTINLYKTTADNFKTKYFLSLYSTAEVVSAEK